MAHATKSCVRRLAIALYHKLRRSPPPDRKSSLKTTDINDLGKISGLTYLRRPGHLADDLAVSSGGPCRFAPRQTFLFAEFGNRTIIATQ